MVNANLLKYPKKSHRKKVILPKYSTRLAEFFGIMIGDGGINNPWQANIGLNSIKDAQYAEYIAKLCYKLFRVRPVLKKRKTKNTLVITLSSTTIVDYLVENGLMRGNKLKQGLKIPDWILEKDSYRRACVRGLIDTDGCLFVHVHKSPVGKTYRNIGLSFVSYSPELIFQVADILSEHKIAPHITKRGRDIYLYQESAVFKYLQVFGSSNDRIKKVYHNWRDARAV